MEESPRPADTKKRWVTILLVGCVTVLVVAILLVLSIWPAQVPELVGEQEQAALELIDTAGFRLGTRSQLATDSIGAGAVIAQQPAPLVNAPRRSSIDITVAVAPVDTKVPNVVGLASEDALALLDDALFLSTAVSVFDAEVQPGLAVGQAPAAGSDWRTGYPVAVAVSEGPDDGTGAAVPDLSGRSLEDAFAAVEGAGLVGYAFVRDIGTPEENVVVAQLPEAGVVVRPGTTVLMLLRLP